MKETIEKISFEDTEKPDSVERLFCESLDKTGEREPLNESIMSVLVGLALSDNDKIKEMFESAKKITSTVSIFQDRTKSLGLSLDDKTVIFFGLISGTPGIAVMYSYYLAYAIKKTGKRRMAFDDIMVDVFPDGLFTDSTLTKHWDLQKVVRPEGSKSSYIGDNLLDYPRASQSLLADLKSES
jgi:hypothetical protein